MKFEMLAILMIAAAARTCDASKEIDPGSSTQVSYGHQSATDCDQCHGQRVERSPSGDVRLVASVPLLCLGCHEGYTAFDEWVHRPVAAGDCLLCHTPHRTTDRSSLTGSIPQLCHQCHTAPSLALVAGHSNASHAQCGDCHESHAGPNRKLLKHDFLRTDAGAPYRDQAPRHQLQYIFMDPRGSLVGLAGVRVVAAIERSEAFSGYGLTEDSLRKEVESRLRESGVRVLSGEEGKSRQPGLHVCLRLMELPLQGRSPESKALSGNLSLSLRQTVELLSGSSDTERKICTATTWDTSALVVWGTPQIQGGFQEAVGVLAGRFCRDYLAANPPKQIPASPSDGKKDGADRPSR